MCYQVNYLTFLAGRGGQEEKEKGLETKTALLRRAGRNYKVDSEKSNS